MIRFLRKLIYKNAETGELARDIDDALRAFVQFEKRAISKSLRPSTTAPIFLQLDREPWEIFLARRTDIALPLATMTAGAVTWTWDSPNKRARITGIQGSATGVVYDFKLLVVY